MVANKIQQTSTSLVNYNDTSIEPSGASGFFTTFTVKTVIPGRQFLDKLLSCPRDAFDWLKTRIFIPLLGRVIILLSSTNSIEKICKHEQILMKKEISKLQHNFTLGIVKIVDSGDLPDLEIIKATDSAIKELSIEIKNYCDNLLERNNALSCAQRIKIISTISNTLKEFMTEEMICKRLSGYNHLSAPFIASIGKILESYIAETINELEEKHKMTFSEFPSTVCPASDGYNSLNLSEENVNRMQNESKTQYLEQIVHDAKENEKIKLSDNKGSVIVPRLFTADVVRGNYIFSQENNTPSSSVMEGKTEERGKFWSVEEFIEQLQTMTKDKQAIYTICSHLTQLVVNNVNNTIHAFIKNSLSLNCLIASDYCDRSIYIEKDPDDENKIIITHNIMLRHKKIDIKDAELDDESSESEDSFDVEAGPNSLYLISASGAGHVEYLSSYQKDWLNACIKHSVKITVDLNHPDRATVENKGPFISLPRESTGTLSE